MNSSEKLQKKTIVKWVIILGALGGLIVLAVRPKKVDVEAVPVTRGELIENLRADAIFRSKVRQVVSARADGDLKRIEHKVGDLVKKGDRITDLAWDVTWEPVRAPSDGVVSKVFRESAGPVRRGESLIEIVDPAQLEAYSEILTSEVIRIPLGAPVVIRGWGGEEPIRAKVQRVSQAGFTKPSALGVDEEKTEVVYEIESLPAAAQGKLGSHFHGEASLELGRYTDVVKVSVGALFRQGESWALYKISNGRAQKSLVEVGPKSDREVILTKGDVTEGDQVVNYPGDNLKEGARVRVLKR